jgi:hypothetical protein
MVAALAASKTPLLILFPAFRRKIQSAAWQVSVIPAFTLALLQHLRRDLEPNRLRVR